jgi:hypothetical protein
MTLEKLNPGTFALLLLVLNTDANTPSGLALEVTVGQADERPQSVQLTFELSDRSGGDCVPRVQPHRRSAAR